MKKEEKPIKMGNPLDSLPQSAFSLFDFKTLFVNATDKMAAMKEFWETFDPAGYSLYQVKYEKYEGEGEVLFRTSNLNNSFLQRLDTLRKYAFAVQGIYGDEPLLDIKGVWLWRGDGIPEEMKEHISFEYYTFTRLDSSK